MESIKGGGYQMKHSKILRTLALAIILALLVVAIPATPAQAASGTISISPTAGPVGTTIYVYGQTFTASKTYIVYFSGVGIVSGSTGTGTFTAPLTVPTYPRGLYPVTVTTDAPDISNTVYFTVTPQITLSPSSGYVGDQVTVSGTGFNASSSVTIYFDTTAVHTVTATTSGTFSGVTFTVPDSYKGLHTVKGSDASGDSPGVIFTTLPKITVTPTSGGVDDTVTISGTGFAAYSNITFYLDNISVSAGTTTNANGSFTNNTFTIPSTSRGSHTIKARDASGYYATTIFTIAEKIIITPETGASGSTIVTVTGTGFSAYKVITIKYNVVTVITNPATVITDAYGSFTASFNVLAGLAGTYPVEASDGTYSASANFVATADVTLSQTTSQASPGYIGMELTITGTGLKPNAPVTITYTTDPVVLATTTTDVNGAFSVTITIPPSIGGNHTLTITDDHTTKQFTFVMESTPPSTVYPQLPLMDSKLKDWRFDWCGDATDLSKEVTDNSLPITYTLQIATDDQFTTESILLEKTGLTESEYTLTKEERLPSVKKEAPYYWRVRAIDGASNEGLWTGTGSFYVGFIFAMPQWAIYTLFVIGALLLGALGFYLGRRTAYY